MSTLNNFIRLHVKNDKEIFIRAYLTGTLFKKTSKN